MTTADDALDRLEADARRSFAADLADLATVRAELQRLQEEREGYKRDFMAASERAVRLELIIADLNPDGGSKGFSGGA